MSLDKSKIVIALHSLAPHSSNAPVTVIGANNRVIEHARFDQKANRHVFRMPLEQWEKDGEGIIKFGTNPLTQWLPLVEEKEEAEANPPVQTEAEKAGYVVEPTHEALQDKLPEEVTPGHMALPESADITHVPQEPPTPGEQLTKLDDHRIQMVQDVVQPIGKEEPTDRITRANLPESEHILEEPPTPTEQLTKLDDPRIQLVQEIVPAREQEGGAALDVGKEGELAKEQLAEADKYINKLNADDEKPEDKDTSKPVPPAEEKAEDKPNADLDEAGNDFRKLRKIAQAEGVEALEEIKTSKDMRAAIELKREKA